jgi:hypothetical protein
MLYSLLYGCIRQQLINHLSQSLILTYHIFYECLLRVLEQTLIGKHSQFNFQNSSVTSLLTIEGILICGACKQNCTPYILFFIIIFYFICFKKKLKKYDKIMKYTFGGFPIIQYPKTRMRRRNITCHALHFKTPSFF